ncbi:MAG TPA: MMPL family transporter, partial [Polyangia bacterium]
MPHAASETNGPGPRTRGFVAWTLRHGRTLWAVALLLAIPAAWRTVGLYRNLRSDIEELLPRDAPSVVALNELRSRMAGLQYLGVIVDFGTPDKLPAGEKLVDDLAARLATYPREMVTAVRTGFGTERAFVESRVALLLELGDLQTIRQRIEDRVHWEYGKETGTLLDDKEPAPPLDFADIQKKYERRVGGPELVDDRFCGPKLGLCLLLVEVGGFATDAHRSGQLLHRVQADIAALGGPSHYAPGLRVGFAGDVVVSVEEMAALVQDLTLSSVIVIAAVLLVIMLFYRWPRSVPALFLPLGLGAVYAFALASLPPFRITELNSNTAFLGSIIIGNGINFGIIQLARYLETRREGQPIEESLVVSLWGTRRGTLSAALAAGVSYASLTAMQFRGFRQFGVVGGLGMLLSWATMYVLGPSLVAWLDGGRVRPETEARRNSVWTWLARWVTSSPRPILIGATLLTVAAAWQVRKFGPEQLEYDFSRLRRRDTWTSGEAYWGHKMDTLLGRYLTPTVLLTDSPDEARAVASRLREASKRPPLSTMIASVRSLDDVVPPDQAQKNAEVAAIRRKMTPHLRQHISAEDNSNLDRLIGGEGQLPTIVETDVPEVLTTGLRERDGALGRAVLVFPNPSDAMWRGENMAMFVHALRDVAQAPVALGGRAARVAGAPPLTTDIIESMRHDGPLASLLAFLGVVATVVVMFGRGQATPFVIGSLIVGVLWMVGATLGLHIKINFVNFIAFPITFGIGVDYAVNVMARYLRDGEQDVAVAVRGTGAAVALCSMTTIIGYSS